MQHNNFGPLNTAGGVSVAGNTIFGHTINFSGSSNHDDERDNRCIRALQSVDPQDEKRRIIDTKDSLLQDPYRWIFDDQAFQDWFRGDTRLLWIKGGPGKGKTMMTAGIIEWILEEVKRMPGQSIVSYFFCQNTDNRLNRAVSVLKGLIFMLVTQDKTLIHPLRKKYDQCGEDGFQNGSVVSMLLNVLQEILAKSSGITIYFLIDALDECDDPELARLLDWASGNCANFLWVKWLFTSRPSPEFESCINPGETRLRISLEIEAHNVSQGVESFIEHKVCGLSGRKKWPISVIHEVRDYLKSHAEGTFLWVALVCKRLQTLPAWKIRGEIAQLGRLRQGLDSFYERMMQLVLRDNDYAEVCAEVLQAATIAYRPLRLCELDSVTNLPQDLIAYDSPEHDGLVELVERCGSFLTIRESTIYFVHQSAKDYLDTSGASQILILDIAAQHSLIVQRCLSAMSSSLIFKELSHPGSLADDLLPADETVLARMGYVCCYWIDHINDIYQLKRTGDDAVCLKQAYQFFMDYFMPWIEVVARRKEISVVIKAIQVFQKTVVNKAPEFGILLADAYRFLRYSKHIIEEDAAQLYLSALLFSPQNSRTRMKHAGRIPRWIKLYGSVRHEWGATLQTLIGHSDSVNAVMFSPDSSLVASASDDKTVRLWDTATGSQITVLEGHSNSVNAVVFSPDGSLVASASANETIRLWDTVTRSQQAVFDGQSSWYNEVVFSPDGSLVAFTSDNETITLWDVATKSQRAMLKGHSEFINAVAFSPDSGLVVSASYDNTVRLWDAATGCQRAVLDGHLDPVVAAVFSPDSSLVASVSSDETIRLWDTVTECQRAVLDGHLDIVEAVAFTPDGSLVASASGDKTVILWDVATGCELAIFDDHTNPVNAIMFSPDGNLIASASNDNTVRLWDVATRSQRAVLDDHSEPVKAVVFSPDGSLVASASTDSTVRLWDASTQSQRVVRTGHSDTITAVVLSPDGSLVASASFDKTVRLWDTGTGCQRAVLYGHLRSVNAVAFSPDGNLIASASDDKTTRLWDAATGYPRAELHGHFDFVTEVVFSPDGSLVASSSLYGGVILWDAVTGLQRASLDDHSHGIKTIAFSPDGTLVASVLGKMIRLWDTATGCQRAVLHGHLRSVNAVTFSPDGNLIASASDDKTTRLWDAATGYPRAVFHGHLDSVNVVVFSPDGKVIASASNENTVRLWDVEEKQILQSSSTILPIQWLIFEPNGEHISTNCGSIRLETQLAIDTTPSCRASPQTSRISIRDGWVFLNNCRILWLPVEMRSSAWDSKHNVLALGQSSGIISFMRIDGP